MKIAIVEDEMIIANNITDLLEGKGHEVVEPCVTYGQAVEMLETESPDLVFLDIQLAGKKDGIHIAEKIDSDYALPYIYLTSFSDKATLDRVKKTSPMAYLVKPFKKEDLFASIELAIHNYNSRKPIKEKKADDSFFIKTGDLYHKIKFDDILFIKSDHVYVEIYTAEKKHIYRATFDGIKELLPPDLLFQAHRSYLVNLNAITAVNTMYAMVDTHQVPIGKKHKEELVKLLNLQ